MSFRMYPRYEIAQKANWDFFSAPTGKKEGYLGDVSAAGCLLKTSEVIEHRRWVRLILRPMEFSTESGVCYTTVARVVRREDKLEAIGDDFTLYRYGLEFTRPGSEASEAGHLSAHDLDLILALSNKNLTVRSCLMRKERSSVRSEFLA